MGLLLMPSDGWGFGSRREGEEVPVSLLATGIVQATTLQITLLLCLM